MPTGFEPVSEVLLSQRERGMPFPVAWRAALKAVKDREGRQALTATQEVWRDCYEQRESKIRELA